MTKPEGNPEHLARAMPALVKKSGWVRTAPRSERARVVPKWEALAIPEWWWLPGLIAAGIAVVVAPSLTRPPASVDLPSEFSELQSLPEVECEPLSPTRKQPAQPTRRGGASPKGPSC